LINGLDTSNPLYLQNNDNSNVPIVNIKLTSTDNYKMWSSTMKIDLKGKNKMGFVDGTCFRPISSPVLSQQWERCNAIRDFDTLTLLPACTCAAHEGVLKHNQLVRLMKFLMGLNDVYQPIRSNILARDPLLDMKDAFNVVSREESHKGLHPRSRSRSRSKVQPVAFVVKSNNFKGNDFKRGTTNTVNKGPNPNLLCKNYGLIGHTIEIRYEIIGYLACL
ncbi:ribonuclease H-like domain-containing protein, partial [Tanacetum coccineum]